MLVCNVSLRARQMLAADLAEAGAALDNANTLGLGELVSEAASAGATVNAGLIAVAAIVEAAGAADASTGVLAGGIAVSVAEAVAATSTQDATTIAAIVGAVVETATATSAQDAILAAGSMPWGFDLFQQGRWLSAAAIPTVNEATTASATQDAVIAVVARNAMIESVFINSDGTVRQASVNGIMVNL